MFVAIFTATGVRSTTCGVETWFVAYRNTVEVFVCGVAGVTMIAVRGVVGGEVLVADAGVVGMAGGVVARGLAGGCDAGVGSVGVEAERRVALAAVGGHAAPAETTGATGGRARVQLAVVLPAVTTHRVVRPR